MIIISTKFNTRSPLSHYCYFTFCFHVLCLVDCSLMSNSLQPRGLQPFRLLCLWDSPGKNTGVGCHALLQGISLPRDWTQVSHIAGEDFTGGASREAQIDVGFCQKLYLHRLIKLELSRWCYWWRICLTMQETQEMQVPPLCQKDPLEQEMAIHSSILSWRIP